MKFEGFSALKWLGVLSLLTAGLSNSWAASDLPLSGVPRVEHVQQDDLSIDGQAFAKFTLARSDAPPLRFYVSKPSRPAPLILYIQGSGCRPVFIAMGGRLASTVFSLLPTSPKRSTAI